MTAAGLQLYADPSDTDAEDFTAEGAETRREPQRKKA
jgi:hypothetical protein